MNSRKIVIGAVLVLIGLPIVLLLIVFVSFYAVFYFPNRTSATTGTIVSSGEKREYLLYVPKSHDRVVTAPFFVATKLEAFRGRGRGDYTNSHDLEDLLTVIDCREAIVSEIAGAMEVRHYIAEQFRTLLATRAFVDALPGYLLPDASSQGRLPILLSRIKEIAK
jgi:hypothetical protein